MQVDGCDPLETATNAVHLHLGGWSDFSTGSREASAASSSSTSSSSSKRSKSSSSKSKQKGRGMLKRDLLKDRHLVLFANATRRAPWHAKLGFQQQQVFPVSLRSLLPGGGPAPCIIVTVVR